jgi:hypothetical protein
MSTSHNWQSVSKQQNLLNVGKLARKSVRLYPRTPYTDRKSVNVLRRGWIRQIIYLGDRWLLATSVPKKQDGFITPDAAVFITVVALSVIAFCMEAPV